MKVAELLLAALVVTLAGFVATQARVVRSPDLRASAGVLASADTASPTGVISATENVALSSGRTSERVTSTPEYVRDVPREPALPVADMQRRLAQGAAGTYIDELLNTRDSLLSRWPDRRSTPLRVWIGDGGTLDGWQPQFSVAVRDAFEEWSSVGIPVRFTFVRDSAGADVHVRFIDRFDGGISGRTIWSRDSAFWLVSGSIDLAVSHPMGGPVTLAQLYAISLHEIGHLLGLDHIDDQSNIMAPRVRARSLSDADRATARLIYSVPAGAVRAQ
jgi:hypothetical protein